MNHFQNDEWVARRVRGENKFLQRQSALKCFENGKKVENYSNLTLSGGLHEHGGVLNELRRYVPKAFREVATSSLCKVK